jgi:hypothetical protein
MAGGRPGDGRRPGGPEAGREMREPPGRPGGLGHGRQVRETLGETAWRPGSLTGGTGVCREVLELAGSYGGRPGGIAQEFWKTGLEINGGPGDLPACLGDGPGGLRDSRRSGLGSLGAGREISELAGRSGSRPRDSRSGGPAGRSRN